MIRQRQCRRQLVRNVLISAFTFILVTFILSQRYPVKVKAKFTGKTLKGNPFVTIYPRFQGNQQPKKIKTILLWSRFFGSETWGTGPRTFLSCAEKRCHVTTARERVEEADAVVMCNRGFSSLSDLPPTRSPHQVWILHGSEPPYYVYLDWDRFHGVFNWTSWYRADADIFSPYGKAVPITSTSQPPPLPDAPVSALGPDPAVHLSPFLSVLDKSPDIPPSTSGAGSPNASHTPQASDYFAMHDRLVFWAASSCRNQNSRYRVVEELKRHLPVDSYGECGTLTCDRYSKDCREALVRYKFVLAFENGNCRDYVTEKYWNALRRYQIPIVMGGANYSERAIPGSFIDVNDFPTIRDLARFVLRVAGDRALYNSFHAWRGSFQTVDDQPILDWCQACQALHDETRPPQTYTDLKGWVAADSCPLYSDIDKINWTIDRLSFMLLGR